MWRLGVVLLLSSACSMRDDLRRCGDLLCPSAAVCLGDRCVDSDSLDACAGVVDGGGCSTGREPEGVCVGGECVARGCGNALVEADEVCDDGNRVAGDGCASDCGGLDTCPPLGSPLAFRGLLQQATNEMCGRYTESRDIGLAVIQCTRGVTATTYVTLEGPIGGPLVDSPGLTNEYSEATITPEGDALYVRHYADGKNSHRVMSKIDGVWTTTGELAISGTVSIGRPSRGPARRVMTFDLEEYVIDGATATQVHTHLFPGFRTTTAPDLSADGLRAFLAAETGQLGVQPKAYVAERPSLDVDFGPPQPISTLDTPSPFFVTDNCDRMYLSLFNTMFYVRQTPAAK